MLLATLLVVFTLALSAASRAVSGVPSQMVLAAADLPAQDFTICDAKADYLLRLDDLAFPQPAKAGNELPLVLGGELSDVVPAGSTVRVTVKLAALTLLDGTYDFCERIGEVVDCPLPEGDLAIDGKFVLPSIVPPGTYTVKLQVFTPAKKEVTCFSFKFKFV